MNATPDRADHAAYRDATGAYRSDDGQWAAGYQAAVNDSLTILDRLQAEREALGYMNPEVYNAFAQMRFRLRQDDGR